MAGHSARRQAATERAFREAWQRLEAGTPTHPDLRDHELQLSISAVYLINAICSVPTVPLELDRYPRIHLDFIRYWTELSHAHRDAIVHGTLEPQIRLGQVPCATNLGG